MAVRLPDEEEKQDGEKTAAGRESTPDRAVSKDSQSGGGSDKKKRRGGARINHEYHDRTEQTVGVTRDDLSEIRDLGPLHEGLMALGTFFASGAFWLAVTLLAEHQGHYKDYVYGFLFCGISLLFGLALMVTAHKIFEMKQHRLNKYFPEVTAPS